MPRFNPDCPCKNVNCERHGKCDECTAFHNGNTSCKRLADEAAAQAESSK